MCACSMKRVMIVDAAAFMRLILREILESNGCEIVAEAANGEEAIRLYEIHKPDIVTMDITLPVLDGLEATQTILAENPNAQIIICSAMSHHDLIMEMIDIGVKDFIVKPFQEDRIIAAVDRLYEQCS